MSGRALFGLWKRSRPAATPQGVEGALTGYFELRPDRIVGWAEERVYCGVDSMRIEVLRHGHIIAACDTTPQPKNPELPLKPQHFAFNLPIADRFIARELLTEDVTVVVRDSRGNTGRVLPDGAAQLELIRDHLGTPCVRVLDLDFSRGGNSRPYLGAGWSGAEPDLTWAEDEESIIQFDSPAEPGTYALRTTAGALILKSHRPQQRLEIFLNHTSIAGIVYTEGHVQFREIKFPHEAFGGAGRATLRLYHPDAVRPCDISNNEDRRRISFYFKRLSIVRLPDDE